jgi:hypothetical protein
LADDCPKDHLATDAAFELGSVSEQRGELNCSQAPGPEGFHLSVSAGEILDTSEVEIPLGRTKGGHQVLHLVGRDSLARRPP